MTDEKDKPKRTWLTTDELAEKIKYDARTIRTRLKDRVLIEGIHYVRPFGGRKLLFHWEQIEADMAKITESSVGNGAAGADDYATPVRTQAPRDDRWSALEDKQLREAWGKIHITEICTQLCRSKTSIYQRAQKIGLERPDGWSEAEMVMLTTYYPSEGPKGCAMRLGRTEKAIQLQARRNGLKMRPNHGAWTAKEDAVLRLAVGRMALREIYETFFRPAVDDGIGREFCRSYAGVAQRCGALGISLSREDAAKVGRV